jgi:hypothetical protein
VNDEWIRDGVLCELLAPTAALMGSLATQMMLFFDAEVSALKWAR